MHDSKFLYFLRTFPAWIVLCGIFIVLIVLYRSTGDLAYKEWASLALASLFTALGIQRGASSPQTSQTQNEITADTVKVNQTVQKDEK